MPNSINVKQQFAKNNIPNQTLSYANQLTTQQWNTIINTLSKQTNDTTKYLQDLHQWLIGYNNTEYTLDLDGMSFYNYILGQLQLKADKTYVDEQKANKTDLPTKVSQLENDKGYLTQHQDISHKADKTDVDKKLNKETILPNGDKIKHEFAGYYSISRYRPTHYERASQQLNFTDGEDGHISLVNKYPDLSLESQLYLKSDRASLGLYDHIKSISSSITLTYDDIKISAPRLLFNDKDVATQEYVHNLLSNFSSLDLRTVDTLPTEDISTSTIYLLKNDNTEETNIYEEYIYINNKWEMIGTTKVDLSNYATINDVQLLSKNISTLVSQLDEQKANKTDLPTKVSQLENDSNYTTEDYVKDYVKGSISNVPNNEIDLSGYGINEVTHVEDLYNVLVQLHDFGTNYIRKPVSFSIAGSFGWGYYDRFYFKNFYIENRGEEYYIDGIFVIRSSVCSYNGTLEGTDSLYRVASCVYREGLLLREQDLYNYYTHIEVDALLLNKISRAEAEDYVDTKVSNLVNSAPETLDTLGELAQAINNHEDSYDALLEVVGNKADKTEIPEIPEIPTKVSQLENDSNYADKKFVEDTLSAATGGTDASAVKVSLEAHKSDTNNPHNVTASQLGLGNVNNTSDADKPISNATQTALNAKADKTELPTKTSQLTNDSGFLTLHQDVSGKADITYVDSKVADLVNSAPEALDTLSELATAINNHEDAYDALLEVVGNKANASDVYTKTESDEVLNSYISLEDFGTEILENENLNNIKFMTPGKYYCPSSDVVKTLKNVPDYNTEFFYEGFIMIVYAPLYIDGNTSYKTREIINTHQRFIQKVYNNRCDGWIKVQTDYESHLILNKFNNNQYSTITLYSDYGNHNLIINADDEKFNIDSQTLKGELTATDLTLKSKEGKLNFNTRFHTIKFYDDSATGNLQIYTVRNPSSLNTQISLGTLENPWTSIYGTTIYQGGKQVANKEDIPTTLPASDVYSWAKASSKPTYTWSEITSKPTWIGSSKPTYSKSDVGLGNVLNVASYSKTESDSKYALLSSVKTYKAGTGISISSDGTISVNLPTAEGSQF